MCFLACFLALDGEAEGLCGLGEGEVSGVEEAETSAVGADGSDASAASARSAPESGRNSTADAPPTVTTAATASRVTLRRGVLPARCDPPVRPCRPPVPAPPERRCIPDSLVPRPLPAGVSSWRSV
ncbi:hypothetical protein Srufu_077620 [Streptomyces libani subsp. rufus]|nr:hypothetical protein Srufu_077620 [Streptomyces libani subsp. rufus]